MKYLNFSFKTFSWANKYSLTVLAFIIWIVFLDSKHSIVKQYKLNRQINELKESKKDYLVKLEDAKLEYNDLTSNKEKYAREKYFISKTGEDVYIIE